LIEKSDWELQRDRDGIQIYTRAVEGSPYDAVRSVTVLDDVRLSALVALVEDTDACPEWADRCAESYVFKRLAPNESLIYTHNDLPFPVKDRDVLAHVIWTQDPATGEVVMQSRATQGEMEEVKGRLRLTDAMASWHFRPLATGAVEVINEAHINPGSALPGWLTNMLLVDTPFRLCCLSAKQCSNQNIGMLPSNLLPSPELFAQPHYRTTRNVIQT